MTSLPDHIRRHALRALFLSAGLLILASCPPAFAQGLPGPGLWCRITAAGLLVCALLLPLPEKTKKRQGSREALMLLISGMVWTALLLPAGWAVSTFLAGFLACRGAGCSLKESLLLPALLCLLLQVGIVHLLQWPLPEGALPGLMGGN